MQCFLVDIDFIKSARYLDNRRLGKQLIECYQIYDTIINKKKAWSNHPAVDMWRNHIDCLLYYGLCHYNEWKRRLVDGERGGKLEHKSGEFIISKITTNIVLFPKWVFDNRVHLSHKSNLIRKKPEYYKPFWPDVPDNLPYFWPIQIIKGKWTDET